MTVYWAQLEEGTGRCEGLGMTSAPGPIGWPNIIELTEEQFRAGVGISYEYVELDNPQKFILGHNLMGMYYRGGIFCLAPENHYYDIKVNSDQIQLKEFLQDENLEQEK